MGTHLRAIRIIDPHRKSDYIRCVNPWNRTWNKALTAAALLARHECGHKLNTAEKQLAATLAKDPVVTNRLLGQALRYLETEKTNDVSVSSR